MKEVIQEPLVFQKQALTMKTFVTYLRVSTTKQGLDGLGMAVHEQAIKAEISNVIVRK